MKALCPKQLDLPRESHTLLVLWLLFKEANKTPDQPAIANTRELHGRVGPRVGLVVGIEGRQLQPLQVPGVWGDRVIVAGFLEDAGPRDRVFQLPCSIPETEWYLHQGGLWLPGTGV